MDVRGQVSEVRRHVSALPARRVHVGARGRTAGGRSRAFDEEYVMRKTLAALVLTSLCVTGCTSYYKVHDPSTGKDYYTTNVDAKQGATTLTDARTGNKVSVQNSEVSEISKEQFEQGKYTAPAGGAAPSADAAK
jgi:hypothetical protein